jgi:hypothetical protein
MRRLKTTWQGRSSAAQGVLPIAINDLVGDDPAGNPLTSAASRLSFIVVDAAMDDQSRAIVIEDAPLTFP